MTPERKKALITIMTTLIIGILIGALAVGLWSKQSRGGRPGGRQSGKEAFVKRIFTVVEADSAQAKQLRPLINETMARENMVFGQQLASAEAKEAFSAFLEKRTPRFTGE